MMEPTRSEAEIQIRRKEEEDLYFTITFDSNVIYRVHLHGRKEKHILKGP